MKRRTKIACLILVVLALVMAFAGTGNKPGFIENKGQIVDQNYNPNPDVLVNRNWYYSAFATLFWSSTSHGAYKAWAHGLNEYNYSVSYYPAVRSNAFSVRCLKDQ